MAVSHGLLGWFLRGFLLRGCILRDEKEKKRRDSISMVGPYARIRAIVAVLIFLLAFVVIGYRSFFG